MGIFSKPIEFEWDAGNSQKSLLKHRVSQRESEESFFDRYRKMWKDTPHSAGELRYILLGQVKKRKILFVAFTIRGRRVRIISARDANKKERSMYVQAKKAKKISPA